MDSLGPDEIYVELLNHGTYQIACGKEIYFRRTQALALVDYLVMRNKNEIEVRITAAAFSAQVNRSPMGRLKRNLEKSDNALTSDKDMGVVGIYDGVLITSKTPSRRRRLTAFCPYDKLKQTLTHLQERSIILDNYSLNRLTLNTLAQKSTMDLPKERADFNLCPVHLL